MSTPDPKPSDTKRLLGLVMIVKNEANRIRDAIRFYLGSGIADEATILDTGSTDGTQEIVRGAIEDGFPVRIFEEPFVDFSTSRNHALDLHATRTEFVLMVNVDRIEGSAELRSFLEAHRDRVEIGALRVRIKPGHYFQASVLRTSGGWRYVGRTHEVITGPETGSWMGPVIPDVSVIVDRSTRPPSSWAARWRRDLILLDQDMAERPSDPRPIFYLGQTHECLAMLPSVDKISKIAHLSAAKKFYELRSGMKGYRDEAYEALFRHARVTKALEATEPDPDPTRAHANIVMRYLEAHAFDPRRAEPLCALAEYYLERGEHALSYLMIRRAAELPLPQTDLFLDETAYTSRASDLVAVNAYYLRDIDPSALAIGSVHMQRAIAAAPEDPRIRDNLSFYEALNSQSHHA